MKLKLKRIAAMLLVVAMVLGMMPAVFGSTGNFTDVHDDAWYAEYVQKVTDQGYMNGVGNNKFDPEGTTTRAMAVTVLYRLAGQPPVGGPSTFTDLYADWYANPIAWAQKNGVVNGVTATTFCPDQNVTREQLVTMIWRYYGNPAPEGTLAGFADAAIVNEYAREAFAWAIGKDIINGMPKGEDMILAPLDYATRAQFAKIIVAAVGCTHEWGVANIIKEATCGAAGEASYTCTLCGETKTEEIPATDKHTWDEGKITTAPTCKEEGVKTYTCSVCGGTKTESVEKTNEHIYVDGKCSVCGKPKPQKPYVLTDTLTAGDKVVIVAAAKNMALSATYNGFYNSAVAVTPVDGQLDNPAEDIVWTVGVEGDYYTFSYGDQKIGMADSYSSMPLGEVHNTWQVLPAKTEGAFYLFNVGRQVYMEYYETNSNWSGYYNNAAEELFALNFYVQSDAHKHTWDEGKVTTAATCAKEGVKTYTCTECGETKEETIPATGKHVDANKDNKCDTCGKGMTVPTDLVAIYNVAHGAVMTTETSVYTSSSGSVKDQLVAATATLADGKLTSDATNVALFKMETNDAGITTFITADGKYMEADGTNIRFVDAPNQNTEFVLDEVEGGYYIRLANYKYQDTKDQYIEYYTSKNVFTCYGMGTDTTMYVFAFYPMESGECEHDWVETETVEPTCSTDGKTVYICSKCGATDEESIPATGVCVDNNGDNKCDDCGNSILPSPEDFVLTDTLKDGDQVVIVAAAKNMALSATYNGYYNSAVAVEPVDGVLANPAEDIIWTVGVEGDSYTFSYNGQKIGMADSYSSMPLGEVHNTWQILPAATEGAYYVFNVGRQVYLEYYEKNSNWSGYYNNSDEALFAMNFYVKGATPPPAEEEVVILYTNDIHTYINNEGLKYSNVAALKAELEAEGKTVILVDAGDHVQGTAYGSMDNGETIIKLMNAAGYDLATLGNHEFDYGMARALELVGKADYPYVSANFYHEKNGVKGETVLDAYKIFELEGKKFALIGITTPETFTKSTPAYFMDENGNYIYGIAGGETGAELYADVQAAINAAKAEGADYVIALGHLGDDPASKPWTSEELIANVTGLNAFIDGHSHSTVVGKQVSDKSGKKVLLTQTGQYLDAIGMMTIKGSSITTALITEYANADEEVKAIESAWAKTVDELLGEVIAQSEVDFRISDDAGNRLIRKQETNLGDFCADALYYLFDVTEGLGVDIAIMNGGGIRANMPAGDISYNSAKTVHTFGNVACLIEVSGQQILDALEWGAKNVGVGENGGLLHVAGVTYEIHSYIPSTVQQDDKAVWAGAPTGEYRVKNVKIGGEDLDLTKTYKMAGYNYTLRDLGDGFAMFGGAVNVKDYVMEDYMVLANYIKSFPNGTIKANNSVLGADYSNINGEGRIKIVAEGETCTDHSWDDGVTTEPTCTADGKTVYTCTKCGTTDVETIPATGVHTYENGKCTGCGKPEPSNDLVAIFNVINGAVMTTEVSIYNSKEQLVGAPATLVDGELSTAAENVALFKVETNDAGITTFVTEEGKYMEADGSNIRFVDEPTANTEFILDEVEGGYYIRLANYKYQDTKDQYIEFYTSKNVYTVYGMGSDTSMYIFNFYPVGGEKPHVCTWDNGVVTKAAACETTGVKTYTCTDCGATKEETIPATGHTDANADNYCDTCNKQLGGTPDPGTLADGKYVIAAYVDGKYYAMANDFNGKVNGVEITVTDGKVSAADAAGYVIDLGTSGSGRTIYGANGYLGYASSTNMAFVADPYVWNIAEGTEAGTWNVVASTADTRALLYQAGNYHRFGAYALSNLSKAEYSAVVFLPVA